MDNLLDLSQFSIRQVPDCFFFSRFLKSFELIVNMASSENISVLKEDARRRLLIKIKNNREPSDNLCGMPISNLLSDELTLFTDG